MGLGLTWIAAIPPHSFPPPSSSSSSLSRFSALTPVKFSASRALNRSKGIEEQDLYDLSNEGYDDELQARLREKTKELHRLLQHEDQEDGEEEEDDNSDEEEEEDGEEEEDYTSDEEELEPENPLDRLSVPRHIKEGIDIERYGFKTWLDDFDPFPSKITVRSSINKFYNFKRVLKEQKLRKQFKESLFGQFYDLSYYWKFNGRLVHSLLLRRIKDKKLHEMWFLVDGKPVCFGLNEFFLMTGLNCRSKPSASEKANVLAKGKAFWNKVTENDAKVTSDNIIKMLESKRRFNREEKLKLSLLWFLHTILMARDESKSVDKDWILMVDDLKFFSEYPWGKECFDITLDYLKNRLDMANHQRTYIERGKVSGYALFGFPWAFQAWVYEAFPAIGRKAGKTNLSPLPLPRMLKWHRTKVSSSFDLLQGQGDTIKIVHPYLIPTVHEMKKRCLQSVVPHSIEVQDEAIDSLKAELKGVTAIKERPEVPAGDAAEEDFDDGRGDEDTGAGDDDTGGGDGGRVGSAGPSTIVGTCMHCGASDIGPSMQEEILTKLAAVEDQLAEVVEVIRSVNEMVSKRDPDIHVVAEPLTFPDVPNNGKLIASTIVPNDVDRHIDETPQRPEA